MVVSNHHQLSYPLNPIDSCCPHLFGESSEMIIFLPHRPNLAPLVAIGVFPFSLEALVCTNQATSHYLNKWWLVYWCIYGSLGLSELTNFHSWNCIQSYVCNFAAILFRARWVILLKMSKLWVYICRYIVHCDKTAKVTLSIHLLEASIKYCLQQLLSNYIQYHSITFRFYMKKISEYYWMKIFCVFTICTHVIVIILIVISMVIIVC